MWNIDEVTALKGNSSRRGVSRPVIRMVLRENARERRLRSLAGVDCPTCQALHQPQAVLRWDGARLRCLNGHTYSNADAAEADVLANPADAEARGGSGRGR